MNQINQKPYMLKGKKLCRKCNKYYRNLELHFKRVYHDLPIYKISTFDKTICDFDTNNLELDDIEKIYDLTQNIIMTKKEIIEMIDFATFNGIFNYEIFRDSIYLTLTQNVSYYDNKHIIYDFDNLEKISRFSKLIKTTHFCLSRKYMFKNNLENMCFICNREYKQKIKCHSYDHCRKIKYINSVIFNNYKNIIEQRRRLGII